MALTTGTRLGPYEILSALGAGGMSACGHAELRPWDAEATLRQAQGRPELVEGRGIGVSSRWGWGPSASEKMMSACGRA